MLRTLVTHFCIGHEGMRLAKGCGRRRPDVAVAEPGQRESQRVFSKLDP